MDSKLVLEYMHLAEKLKCNTRHSWTSSGRQESVSEHCHRMSMFAYFIKDQFPEADIDKVVEMCVFHDIGEAITGDIPSFYKTEKNEEYENQCRKELFAKMPQPLGSELTELMQEFEEQNTLEAKIAKALDKLEAVIQHDEADISTWIPLEFDLQYTYAEAATAFSEYLTALKEDVDVLTTKRIEEATKRTGGAVILASNSPRRKELLTQMGISFIVRPATGEEVITSTDPEAVVKELSEQKAAEVAKNVEDGIIIGADTVVAYQGEIMGKPKDEQDAFRMLKALQGNTHQVYTGVTIIRKKAGEEATRTVFAEKTEVVFFETEDEDLKRYIRTGDCMDKAGSYGIQTAGGFLVKEIHGDYNNVVGLPAAKVKRILDSLQ